MKPVSDGFNSWPISLHSSMSALPTRLPSYILQHPQLYRAISGIHTVLYHIHIPLVRIQHVYIYISIHAIVCIYLFVYVDCWLLIVVCTHLITSSSKFHLCYDSSSCNLIYNPCVKHVPWNNVVYVHPTLSIQNRSYPAIIPSNYS